MDNRHSAEPQSALSPAVASKGSLGADLTVARLRKNVELRQVSDETHISLRHLQNLEEGRYAELPGGMYNRAFLRTYCVYLGLDPEHFLDRFEKEATSPNERVIKSKPRAQPMPSPSFRIPPVLVWTVMLLISVTGLYFSRTWIAEVFSPYFSRPPATRLPSPAPTQTSSPKPAPPAAPDAATATPPAQSTETVPAATSPVVPQPVPGTIRLQFEGVQPCWMSVTSDGNRVYSGTVQPGETPTFDAKERFEIVLGNAGGVTLKINGKPAKPLGKPGAIAKFLIDAQTIPELLEKKGA